MKVPQLRKKPEIKSCHNVTWEDNYSWIHQKDILEVLKDKNKLNKEVEEYLIQENNYTDYHLKDTKALQKNYLMKSKVELSLMMSLFHIETILMITGLKLQLREITL